MLQKLNNQGYTFTDAGGLIVVDKYGAVKRLTNLNLTTIGTSGPATLIGNTLNIPDYTEMYFGTVTSVGLSAGTGISIGGTNPVTSSGTISVTNTAPDQIVSLTSGTGISVSGTYPNFTITNSSPSPAGAITGSGTTNYLSKWTSSSALGNSLVFDNGTNVGVNTATPSASYLLDVNGTARFSIGSDNVIIKGQNTGFAGLWINKSSLTNNNYTLLEGGGSIYLNSTAATNLLFISKNNGTSAYTFSQAASNNVEFNILSNVRILNFANDFYLYNRDANALILGTNNTERARITANGRLLIGTSTESTYELDVVGDIRSTLDANINGLTVGKGGGSVGTNTAFGYEALFSNTSATNNVSLGYRTLRSVTTGGWNVGIGANSVGDGTSTLFSLTTGNYNVGVGIGALRSLISANGNVALGYAAGESTTAQYGTFNGYAAGYQVTTGEYNTIVGGLSGWGITTGSNNTIIGARVQGLSASLSNTIILADGQGNQRLYINNTGLTGLGITSPANALHIDRGTATASYLQFTAGTTTGQTASDGFEVGIDASGNGVINQQENLPMLFYTNNTERMRIEAGGRVNIGDFNNTTSGPSLSFRCASGSFSDIQFINGGSSTVRMRVDGSVMQMNTPGGIRFNQAQNETSETMRIGTNVLIGTTTDAGFRLDINGTSRVQTSAYFATSSGAVGVGTSSPNASALLDVSSTTKGFLPPRMTGAQAEAIATPAAGLLVYANNGNGTTITSTGWWGYNGTTWVKLN